MFQEGLGKITGVKARIEVHTDAKPRYFKPRPVPYALRNKIEAELERLQSDNIVEPVKFSEWAAPIVPVLKPDGSVRICGDYKVTVNKVSQLDNYPIPSLEDLYAKLSGGKFFTKLDLSHAYEQICLDEASKKYTTINTHKGLFCYNRLCYGISSAPGIFQRVMEQLLADIPKLVVRIDDILFAGESLAENLHILEEVLQRLSKAGIRLKKSKCVFLSTQVTFCGHIVDKDGLHTCKNKVEAIEKAPAPKNVTELRSYLGLLNFYGKFLRNLSSILAPLHQLLKKDAKWVWKVNQQRAFNKTKEMLQSATVLTHYDDKKGLLLSCDASPYGLGAVLSHRMPDGSEKPISFASRSLAPAEKNYSQLDKEGLTVVFAVKKFHQYLFGRRFSIFTDHKPLLGLFGPKPTPIMASPRLQRWILLLSGYEFEIKYRPGSHNSNADAMSRLPVPSKIQDPPVPGEIINLVEHLEGTPVTAKQIKLWTSRDVILAKVLNHVLYGWPEATQEEALKPFFNRKEELSVQDGCLLWGSRVIVPTQGRSLVLQELHQSHPGVSRMKALARMFVWWPGLDKEIETTVKHCYTCEENHRKPRQAPLHPWEWPSRPWTRLHLDYAGPFMGKMFLVLVDATTKWVEVEMVEKATSEKTIEILRKIFATHGLPRRIVTDNATVFTSCEMKEFFKRNAIGSVTSAPYHPSTNGLAERYVQTFKRNLKKMSCCCCQSPMGSWVAPSGLGRNYGSCMDTEV